MKKLLKKALTLSLCVCMMAVMATGASASQEQTDIEDIPFMFEISEGELDIIMDKEIIAIDENNRIIKILHQYVPSDLKATPFIDAASGTTKLATEFQHEYNGNIMGSLTLHATFDWNKNSNTVRRYNEYYNFYPGTNSSGDAYFRSFEFSYPSYNGKPSSSGVKLKFQYGNWDNDLKNSLQLICFADGTFRK